MVNKFVNLINICQSVTLNEHITKKQQTNELIQGIIVINFRFNKENNKKIRAQQWNQNTRIFKNFSKN